MERSKPRRRDRSARASFAKRLIALMTERGLGVREAAKAAQVPASTIVSWRSSASPSDFIAVRRLARALGVSLSFLLTGEEDDGRPEGVLPAVSEVFTDGGEIFDGYAKITVQRLLVRQPDRKDGK